jgi:GNAT superfamily N-acetyltransferase
VLIEPLAPKHAGVWADLFARAESPCFCRYWHFTGDKNAWLDRCANHPEENRAEAAFEDALVAIDEGKIVGHLKIAPRATLPKLRKLPVYRALDLGPDDGVFSIGCMLVDPGARRHGVARALVEATPAFVRARGGTIVEAYPRRPIDLLREDEAWMGPEALYRSCGFTVVNEDGPYLVMRLTVGP